MDTMYVFSLVSMLRLMFMFSEAKRALKLTWNQCGSLETEDSQVLS